METSKEKTAVLRDIIPHHREVKTALRRENLSDTFVCAKYRFSPYMACQHGCLYCDGRAERYYVEGEFHKDIVIRINIAEVLEVELPKLREKGVISIGSGVSDAYQPVESQEKLMRKCAEVLARHEFPVTLLTKSALIMRDLDLWSEVNRRAGFVLAVSLTFADDETRRIFEPGAASVDERLEVMQAFKSAGCHVGVLAMPFIPYIADTVGAMEKLFSRLASIGPDFVIPSSLTLRPGRQKETFMELIAKSFPGLLGKYRELYSEDRSSGAPLASYRQELQRRFTRVQRAAGVPFLVPHRVYRGKVHLYDELNILLHHMMELYSDRGIRTGSLKAATKRYMEWLVRKKAQYNRRRSWSYATLDTELKDLIENGGLERLLENRKLFTFLREMVVDRATFDYLTLKLAEKDGSH